MQSSNVKGSKEKTRLFQFGWKGMTGRRGCDVRHRETWLMLERADVKDILFLFSCFEFFFAQNMNLSP